MSCLTLDNRRFGAARVSKLSWRTLQRVAANFSSPHIIVNNYAGHHTIPTSAGDPRGRRSHAPSIFLASRRAWGVHAKAIEIEEFGARLFGVGARSAGATFRAAGTSTGVRRSQSAVRFARPALGPDSAVERCIGALWWRSRRRESRLFRHRRVRRQYRRTQFQHSL